MPLLAFVVTPLGRRAVATLAVLALLAGIYLSGARHARQADTASAAAARIHTMEDANAAANAYRNAGAAERLRAGAY